MPIGDLLERMGEEASTKMPRHDYIFVDESGRLGGTLDPESGDLLSSNFYVAAALHLSDDAFRGFRLALGIP